MYKAIKGGSTADKDGNNYRFKAGDLVPAKKGDLDHCSSLEWQKGVPVDSKPAEKKK